MLRAVATLNVLGLVLLVIAAALAAYALGGVLIALTVAAAASGTACLLAAWAVERPDQR